MASRGSLTSPSGSGPHCCGPHSCSASSCSIRCWPTFTPVLDGTIGRLSVAYLVGFLELMFALIVALDLRAEPVVIPLAAQTLPLAVVGVLVGATLVLTWYAHSRNKDTGDHYVAGRRIGGSATASRWPATRSRRRRSSASPARSR